VELLFANSEADDGAPAIGAAPAAQCEQRGGARQHPVSTTAARVFCSARALYPLARPRRTKPAAGAGFVLVKMMERAVGAREVLMMAGAGGAMRARGWHATALPFQQPRFESYRGRVASEASRTQLSLGNSGTELCALLHPFSPLH
jgi:hypothetical protein